MLWGLNDTSQRLKPHWFAYCSSARLKACPDTNLYHCPWCPDTNLYHWPWCPIRTFVAIPGVLIRIFVGAGDRNLDVAVPRTNLQRHRSGNPSRLFEAGDYAIFAGLVVGELEFVDLAGVVVAATMIVPD
jgi:hypothetical protein